MPNPFYVEPGNDFSQGLKGLTAVVGYKKEQQRIDNEKQAELDRVAKLKAGALEAYKSGDPKKIREYMIQNPEMADNVEKTINAKIPGDTKDLYLNSLFKLLLLPASPLILAAKAPELLSELKAKFAEDGIDQQESDQLDKFEQLLNSDPDQARSTAEAEFALMADDDMWNKYQDVLPSSESSSLGVSSIQEYNLAKSEGYPGTFMDYQKEFGSGAGTATGNKPTADIKNFEYYKKLKTENPEEAKKFAVQLGLEGDAKTNFEILKLRAQIAEIESLQQGRKEAAALSKQKKVEERANVLAGADNILNIIGEVRSQSEDSWLATGVPAALSSWIPSSPGYNIKKNVDTILANLGFDKLDTMRRFSPTGGALGQVSERELGYLQKTVRALDPKMGKEAFEKALDVIQEHYTKLKTHMENPGVPPSYKTSKDPAERQIYKNWIKELQVDAGIGE